MRRAGLAHEAADLERLRLRLDGARPRHEGELLAPDGNAPDGDDRVLPLRLARDELVGGRDGDDLADPRQVLERAGVHGAAVAGDADRRPLRPGDGVGLQAQAADGFDDVTDVLRRRARVHDDEHAGAIIVVRESSVKRVRLRPEEVERP